MSPYGEEDIMKIFRYIAINLFLLALVFHGQKARASFKKIDCHTPRYKNSFTIHKNKIIFHGREKWNNFQYINSDRSLSSIRTKKKGKGFIKVVQFEGKSFSIHLNDLQKFDEINDYLSIRSKRGHEITYPLLCK
jgi:hypothetical protein